MAVARVTEIVSSSTKSIEEAVESGLARASKTLRGITGVEVLHVKAKVADNRVVEWRVDMRLTFVLED